MVAKFNQSLFDIIPPLPDTVKEIPPPFLGIKRELLQSFRVQKCAFKGMRVIVSIDLIKEEFWLHVSYAYRDRIPNWEATKFVKDTFIGRDREAYIKLFKESEYVNDMPYCLHLWHCLSKANYLPDFRRQGTL